jgi:hypothetical protein
MKFLSVLALVATVSAMRIKKADLPHDADLVEKLDPTDRYVNDLSILQTNEKRGSITLAQKGDLPHDADLVEKLDPTDRYVNDLSILQTHDNVKPASATLLQLKKADLPYDADLVEKLDPTDRYVNDLSI